MNTPRFGEESPIQAEITAFADLLQRRGVQAALGYLNHRTPHRDMGLYRFDGAMLRSEVLFDRNTTAVRIGATYCSLVGRHVAPVQILDAVVDPRALGIETL